MRNEYSANLELSTLATYAEEGRKKGKPSREYRKIRSGEADGPAYSLAMDN